MKFMTKIVPKTESRQNRNTHTSKLGKTGLQSKRKTRRETSDVGNTFPMTNTLETQLSDAEN